MKKFISCFSVGKGIIISCIVGIIGVAVMQLINYMTDGYTNGDTAILEMVAVYIQTSFVGGIFLAALFIYPIVLTVSQIVFLVLEAKKSLKKSGIELDQVVIGYGLILEFLYISFMKDLAGADWQEQLTNNERHNPIYSGAGLSITVIFLLGIAGYNYLRLRPLKKIPPLPAVLSISAMYLWVIEVIIFTVQVIEGNRLDMILLLYPVCIVCIVARTILRKIREWEEISMEKSKIHENAFLNFMDIVLSKSALWPLYALILMIPLFGIIIGVLMLFGQAPDSVIKAWTETSGWRLSMKEAPPNVYYDEHYLCTVAAGGHRKIVKPIRKGIRHGHEVIVNRQLCIANAFEQILEEKMPHFHREVRNFYDRYGFPVAKLIKSKWVADFIYLIMKPLEWVFVMVIYMTDVHPENRIALQYTGRLIGEKCDKEKL